MIDQAVIHGKCISEDIEDHLEAVKLLKIHFSNLPDKYQAWKDLHELTHDKSEAVR